MGGGASRSTLSFAAKSSPRGSAMRNSYKAQPTPRYQKPITLFFKRDRNAPPPRKEKELSDAKGKGKGKDDKKGLSKGRPKIMIKILL